MMHSHAEVNTARLSCWNQHHLPVHAAGGMVTRWTASVAYPCTGMTCPHDTCSDAQDQNKMVRSHVVLLLVIASDIIGVGNRQRAGVAFVKDDYIPFTVSHYHHIMHQ